MTTATLPVVADDTTQADLRLSIETDSRVALEHWRCVESLLPYQSVFCSTVWTETWLRHFGMGLAHRFVLASTEDTAGNRVPVGACLLVDSQRRVGPLTIKTTHLGTAGENPADSVCVEYNKLLVDPLYKTAFAQGVAHLLHQESRWDELHLDGFAEDAELFADFSPNRISRSVPSYYFDLSAARAAGQEVLTALGQSTRRNIKQSLKQIDNIHVEWSETASQAHDIFDELVTLHQARWQSEGEPGVYASQVFTGFHRDLISQLVPAGRMVLVRVRAGDETVGCTQFFVENNRLLLYQCGNAAYTNKFSPGLVSDSLAMEEALRRGYDAFDFLGGNTNHKRRLSNQNNLLQWCRWKRPRWKLRLIDNARLARDWIRKRRNLGLFRRDIPSETLQ